MFLQESPGSEIVPDFLKGASETAALLRSHDWATTSLGPPETWPLSLRTAVGICLNASTPIGIYWGEQLVLLYNDAFRQLIGDKHPRALGRPAREVFPEIWPTIEPMFAGVLATGAAAASSEELLPLHVNGRLEDRWFDFSFNPIVGGDGRIEGIFNIAVESTARVRARTDLHASAERNSEILESISDAFYAVDADWRFTYVNRRAEAWWDRRREDLLGKVYWDEFPQAVGSEPYKAHLKAARTREVVRLEAVSPILGHWVDISIYPTADGGLSVYFRDIAEKKQAEERMRQSETRLAGIFAGASVGLSEVGLDGRFLQVNDELCRILGRTRDDLLRCGIADVTHPEDVPPSIDAMTRAVTTGKTSSLDKRYIRPNNETVWANSRVTRLHDPDGGPGNLLVVTVDLSERRAAEERVRASEEFSRRVLASSADCIKVLDPEACIEFMSDGAMCVMEVDDFGAVRGACWPDFWQGDERSKALAAIEAAKRGGTGRFQGFATTMKGSPRWWDVIVTPINGPDGRPEKLLSVSRDITATREAEERVRESEARLREERSRLETLVDSLPVGVCFIGRDGVALQSNPAYRRFLPDEPMPSRMLDGEERWMAWDKRGQRLPRNRYPGALALAGEASVAEFLHRLEDGEERWARVAGVPLRDADGHVAGALVVIVDIDEEKRAQELLERRVAERTAERDRTWNNARDLLLVVGTDGVFRAVNPAWTDILGWSHADLIGRSVFEFVHPEDLEVTNQALATATDGPLPAVENRYRHKDGSYRWISWVAAPESDRIYASGRDVTLEKEREAELEQAQEALRQSQKLEAMGSLTGGVAHDVNNLLSPIMGGLDMLQRRGVGGERERRLIDGALASAERAKTLVQRLLAFARRQPLQPVPVDLAELVEGMADLVASTSGPRVTVKVDVAPGLPQVIADPNQLEMAILNLAVNARDAMPDGGTLTLSAEARVIGVTDRRDLPAGRYVKLTVADTGKGMDADTLRRCIEPFFSTKGIGQGTGLGLSMVHGLAAQLGGALSIKSQVEVGTAVGLWLPVTDERVAASDNDSEVERTAGAGTALLVDDEELVRATTADMLADLGYTVIEATSAEEAVRLLHVGTDFDVVVSDHLMPGMTGTDLAREVRARRPRTPVLIVSGYAEVDGIAPELPRLVKPFRQAELAAALASLAADCDSGAQRS